MSGRLFFNFDTFEDILTRQLYLLLVSLFAKQPGTLASIEFLQQMETADFSLDQPTLTMSIQSSIDLVKSLYRGYSVLFDEYEIYFTSETGFLIFSRVRSTSSHEWKYYNSCLTSEIYSLFINKALNFLFITFSLLFKHVKITVLRYRILFKG
jgi:hypothetical protein